MPDQPQYMPLEKETKGTFRFKDEDPDSLCPVIYVKKSFFPGRPKAIKVTIEAVD